MYILMADIIIQDIAKTVFLYLGGSVSMKYYFLEGIAPLRYIFLGTFTESSINILTRQLLNVLYILLSDFFFFFCNFSY